MKPATVICRKEEGFILVLAIFMLALLSMIGIAAMMTTTTEVDIIKTQRADTETAYYAEIGLTIAAEIIEMLGGINTVDNNTFVDEDGNFVDNATNILIVDGGFLSEPLKDPWCWADQTEDAVCRNRGRANQHEHYAPDIQVRAGFLESFGVDVVDPDRPFIDIDVDRIGGQRTPGGSAEFRGGHTAGFEFHYLIHSVGFLPNSDAVSSERVLGFRFIVQ